MRRLLSKTRTFCERVSLHHRKIGTAESSQLRARLHYGRKAYYVGGHPVWEFLRGVSNMSEKPYFLGGAAFLTGYFWAAITRTPKPVSNELMMFRKLILLVPLLLLLAVVAAPAQQSSKSKSKDRFREKDDRRYPVRVLNADEINQSGQDYAPAYYKEGIVFVSSRDKNGPRDPKTDETYSKLYYAFLDVRSSDTFLGNGLYQGPRSVIPALIGVGLTILFAHLSFCRAAREATTGS